MPKKAIRLKKTPPKINGKLLLLVVIGLLILGISLAINATNFGYRSRAAEGGTCAPGTWGERVPCTISSCGDDGCPADQRMNKACPAGASCAACCYASAIGKCSAAAGCDTNQNGENNGGNNNQGGNPQNNKKIIACYEKNCKKDLCENLEPQKIREQYKNLKKECKNCIQKCLK